MELKWGHLCSDAMFESFGASIANLLTGFGTDPGQPLRLDLPAHLAFRLFASSQMEIEGQELFVILTDTNDQPVSETLPVGEVSFTIVGPEHPLIGGGKIRLDGTVLPSVGAYSFDFYTGGASLVGRLPFTVSPRLGRSTVPKLRDDAPVRLMWAHLMLDVKQNEIGLFNLVGIFEFVPPTGDKGINLKDWLVLVQIEADPTIHIQRQLRLELLDSNNQRANDASGRPVTPVHRPIRLLAPAVGSTLLSSMAPIRFKDDLWLSPGNYRFRFSLDGEALGQPLDIVVLASFPP